MQDTISITVDVDELMSKLEAIMEDEFTTAKLDILLDDYRKEISIYALSFDLDRPVSYGIIEESDDELF